MNEKIQEKINYCLNCKTKPCTTGCPLRNDIPQMIALAKQGQYKEAYEVLCQTTVMPFICGKICPKSKQCQGKCVRGIKGEPVSIGEIENFIGEMALENKWYMDVKKKPQNGKKIAIVGAGPSGITAAMHLAKNGNDVTIFEKHEKIGGILRYGIPEFRLDRKWIDAIEKQLKAYGVNLKCNSELGKEITLQNLRDNFDKVILAFGANISCKMGIPGEEEPYVIGANELLENGIYPDYTNKKVAVIGGGNVAMDASRTIKQKGAEEVTVVYRRARQQMPAEDIEVEEAMEEGVKFLFQVNVKKIEDKKIHCVRTMLVQKEGERPIPVEIENSDFVLDADYVVMAIGSKTDKSILNELELDDKGYIIVDEGYKTSLPNVYACGDNIGGKATVAWASYYARECAEQM